MPVRLSSTSSNSRPSQAGLRQKDTSRGKHTMLARLAPAAEKGGVVGVEGEPSLDRRHLGLAGHVTSLARSHDGTSADVARAQR